MAWIVLPTSDDLFSTGYGLALLMKVALVAVVVALGALQQPPARAGDQRRRRRPPTSAGASPASCGSSWSCCWRSSASPPCSSTARRCRRRRPRRRPRRCRADAVELPLSRRRRHGRLHGPPGRAGHERDAADARRPVRATARSGGRADGRAHRADARSSGRCARRPPARRRPVPRHRRHPPRRHLGDGDPGPRQRVRGSHGDDGADDQPSDRSAGVVAGDRRCAKAAPARPARAPGAGRRDGEQPHEHDAEQLGEVLGLADERDAAVDEVDDGGDQDRARRARRPPGASCGPAPVGRRRRAVRRRRRR